MNAKPLWALMLLVVLPTDTGCATSCNDAGCLDSLVITDVPYEASLLLDVDVCLNDRCNTFDACHDEQQLDGIECFAPGSVLMLSRTSSAVPAFADGDVWDVTVRAADSGEVIAEYHGPVEYRVSRPNGEGCDPTCRTQTVAPTVDGAT